MRIIFVNDTTSAACETSHRTPIRHGSIILSESSILDNVFKTRMRFNKRQATGTIKLISSFLNCIKTKIWTLTLNENVILQLYECNF